MQREGVIALTNAVVLIVLVGCKAKKVCGAGWELKSEKNYIRKWFRRHKGAKKYALRLLELINLGYLTLEEAQEYFSKFCRLIEDCRNYMDNLRWFRNNMSPKVVKGQVLI